MLYLFAIPAVSLVTILIAEAYGLTKGFRRF